MLLQTFANALLLTLKVDSHVINHGLTTRRIIMRSFANHILHRPASHIHLDSKCVSLSHRSRSRRRWHLGTTGHRPTCASYLEPEAQRLKAWASELQLRELA